MATVNYYDKDAVKKRFWELIQSKPALQGLAGSQILGAVNTHQAMASEYALFEAERHFQESYLASAINRSSILAGSYDRNYIPRKASPSTGCMRIENRGDYAVSVPAGTVLFSEDQVAYETLMPVSVEGQHHSLVMVWQVKRETITEIISNPEPFWEYSLSPEKSRQVHQFELKVDGLPWKETRLFRNTNAESMVWAEFYSELDELGIRFGNGIFGKIPGTDSRLTLELVLTEGDVTLVNSKQLYPVGQFDNLQFYAGTAIAGGKDMETTEETRRNALYYFLYDEKHEWDNDYKFYLKEQFPQLLFVNCWGEWQQEKEVGKRKIEHINHIFYSVYAENEPDIHLLIQAALEEIPEYNRYFMYVPVNHAEFTFNIEGRVKRSWVLEEAQQLIINTITQHYGKHSFARRNKAMIRDFYRLMNHSGIFESQEDVYITLSGQREPEKLADMVSCDFDNSTLTLSYD